MAPQGRSFPSLNLPAVLLTFPPLSPPSRYLLASHMTEPGTGWDSAGLVRALRPWASPKEVGRQVVGGYVQFGGCAESAGKTEWGAHARIPTVPS